VPAPSNDPRALIRYGLVGLAVTILLLWVLYLVRGALLLIYVASLVAIGLSPLVAAIERRRPLGRGRVPRWAAILAIYLSVIGVFVGLGMMIVPPLIAQARELWAALPDLAQQAQQWLIDRGLLSRPITVTEAVQQTPVPGSDAVGAVLNALGSVVGGVFGLLTILIIAFYLLVESASIVRTFVRLFPRPERPRVEDACLRVAVKVSAWLAGQLLLAAIIGTTAAIGLSLMGVPYFFVLALIAAIGEMIPVVGPLLAAIPAIAVAFTVSPALALGVAVFFILQQQFENHVLVPKVMERQVGVSAVVVILALLIGGSLLGIMGAILAVPTAAILQVLFEEIVPEAGAGGDGGHGGEGGRRRTERGR
jgi:predicted PurR-regulated permease PerM